MGCCILRPWLSLWVCFGPMPAQDGAEDDAFGDEDDEDDEEDEE